jgi:hypothetical protein
MKKLLLTLTLLISMMMSSQTFTKKYNHFTKTDRITNTVSELESTNLTVIFSGNDKGDIIMYFDSGYRIHIDRFYKTGKIYEGTSKDGLKYRYIETCHERKEKVIIQLFDIGVFRVHTQDATYEYQELIDKDE